MTSAGLPEPVRLFQTLFLVCVVWSPPNGLSGSVVKSASGEASGRLEPMMERAADYLEREFSAFTAVMLSFLEPAIIVVMGGVVALIVLSILLPILQINTLAMG